MFRRFVTTLTIIVLILGTALPVNVYSGEDLGYEGRICRDLGILKGNTGVVDSAYLETKPSRLQAAIMFLRLKGLEQDALSYTGGNNFKDAGAVAWKEGRNVLSYLKNHPEYGWIGDGVNFMPFNLIDAKAYYKVLLESLGYKQKIDGDGDFDWSSVLEFAEDKGLEKMADTKNFTVKSLAIATVEALNSKMKSSGKKLIEHLVETGEVDKGEAISLGLYSKDVEAAVKTVRAISNSKVEVVFEESVDGSEAADEDLYVIKQLDIKNVSMKNASAVIIDTSAMNESTAYTLNFNDKNYSFKGLRKDSYSPKLITAECKDTDLVELTFDRVLDNTTAQDTDIYSIEGVSLKSAELDSTNTKVRLTTSGIQSGHTYTLKIHGIKNGDGATTKSITKAFAGRKDTTAPKLDKLTVLNNVRLLLEFSDKNGLNKSTAQEVDNYRITYSGGSLDVESVQVKDRDEDGLWDSVELLTESQESGKAYTLIIKNIMDASVLQNSISREIKREFRGKSKDKIGPTIARNPKAITDTMIEIEFSDSNALNIESACDLSNYEIAEDLEIEEARIKDPDNLYSAEGRTVLLITTGMEKSETYTLKISGIQDEFENEMKNSGSSGFKTYRFKGVADDRTPPYITSVECIDSKTIELNFDNVLDEDSAENITNYRLDGLALATKAVLQEDDKTVRLTVSSLPSDKNHTILLNNIKDVSGNALSNVSVSVLYNGSLNDNDPPQIADIEAVNENEIWVHFEEEVHADEAKMKASGINFEQVGSILDDGTTIVLRPATLLDDKEYEVTSLTGVWDIRGNAYRLESNLDFYGTDNENEPPEVEDWDQMDVRRFRVVFTEPVLLKDNWKAGIKNPSGISINWTAVLNPDEEDTNEAYSTVDYIAEDKDIPADKDFYFNFTTMVSDYVGMGAYDEEDYDHGASGSTEIESYMEDDEEPYLEYVEAITQTKAQIVFSEEMRIPGSYKITYEDENGRDKTIGIRTVEVDSKDKTRVNIFTEDRMSDDYYYILEPQSAAADIAGNRLDIDDLEIDFEGSTIMSSDYIQGVEMLNVDTFKVTKSSKIYKINSLYELDMNGAVLGGDLIKGTPVRVSDNVYKITSEKRLLREVRYKVTVDGIEYRFFGGIPNQELTLELPEREITYDDMDMDKQNVKVYRAKGDELDVDEGEHCFIIDHSETLRNGEMLYVYVERKSDGVTIYGARIKVEGLLSAATSKEITSFSLTGLGSDAVGNIDQKDNIIRVSIPYGSNVNNLAASFKCSEGAVVKVGSVTQVSKLTQNNFENEVTYTIIAQDGSKKDYKVKVDVEASKFEKKIKSFIIKGLESDVEGIIDNTNHVITLELPAGISLKALVPEIETSQYTTVSPKSGVGKDFSKPVIYKITADDGSTQSYTVNTSQHQNSENSIISFKLEGVKAYETSIVEGSKNTISIKVPYNTNLKKLKPLIDISADAKITPESGEEMDFSSYVKYTVTAQNGTPRVYTTIIIKDQSPENDITYFSFPGISFKDKVNIKNDTNEIDVAVPYGTNLTSLKASFECSFGAKVMVADIEQESGETVNDFSHKVDYTVIAEDGSKEYYEVEVSVEASEYEKKITRFNFEELMPAVIGDIKQDTQEIALKVPYGTNLGALVPNIDISRDTIVEPRSGVVKDFSRPVEYKVMAPDGSSSKYTVSVTEATNSEKLIKEFGFITPKAVGLIDEPAKSINVKVPFGTDVTKLAAVFKCSDNSTIKVNNIAQNSGVNVNDFTNPVKFNVVAQDGSVQEYNVSVVVAAENEKYMTRFEFIHLEQTVKGIIDEASHTIKLSVPEGIDLTNMVASFSYIGKSIQIGETSQYSGMNANNFSENVKYVIAAHDGSTIEYTVLVNK
jgi:hypothetical protein